MYTRLATSAVIWAIASEATLGQLATESINLQAGWNAVWLNLEPEPNSLDEILAAQLPPLDYQTIWTLGRGSANALILAGDATGRWFFHDRDVPAIISTLNVLHGHRGYLIYMRSAGQLVVAGRPLIRNTQFTGQASTLFGVLTNVTSGLLSFEEYFSHPKSIGKVRTSGTPIAHDIFALSAGNYVRRSLTNAIIPNAAYWVNVTQDFEYPGLLDVSANPNGLSFGKNTSLRTLSIEVPSSTSVRSLTLRARDCAALSPGGVCSTSGGSVDWLEFRDPTQTAPVWQPLSGGLTVAVPPGVTKVDVELRARRTELAAQARNRQGGTTVEDFPLLIDVTDQQGARAVLAASVSIEPVFGTWVGRATLNRVSTHPSFQTLPLDQSEAPPIGMTLILDLPDPSVASSGAQLLDSLAIATFRDGRPLTRRFTSVLFDRPVTLTEDSADPLDPLGATGTMHATLHISPEDPLNPYRHRYHPEHRKGYDITRDITITFENPADRLSDELAGLDGTFGPQQLAGHYIEVITGISALPITVQGTFRLGRVFGQTSAAEAGR